MDSKCSAAHVKTVRMTHGLGPEEERKSWRKAAEQVDVDREATPASMDKAVDQVDVLCKEIVDAASIKDPDARRTKLIELTMPIRVITRHMRDAYNREPVKA